MSLVQSRFDSEECFGEYGIYFSNDEFMPVTGSPHEGYTFSSRVSVAPFVSKHPDAWVPIDEQCRVEHGDLSVMAGGTSWEGDGFIAVRSTKNGALIWMLHLCASEVFREVAFESDAVVARSSEYPFTCHLRIPVNNPEMLSVKQIET
jgi:hypothetical protein